MGNFKIDPILEKKYPHFAKFLKTTNFHDIKNNAGAMNFYKKATGLSKDILIQNLTYNEGTLKLYEPTIFATNLSPIEKRTHSTFDPLYDFYMGIPNNGYSACLARTLTEDGEYPDINEAKAGDIALNERLVGMYEAACEQYEKGINAETPTVYYHSWAAMFGLEFLFETTIVHEDFHSGSQFGACSLGILNCTSYGQNGWYSGDNEGKGEVGYAFEDIIYGMDKGFNYKKFRNFLNDNNVFTLDPRTKNNNMTHSKGDVSEKIINGHTKYFKGENIDKKEFFIGQ